MTIIEVLLPDGATHVYTTEERSDSAVAKEVDQLFPDATLWRKSEDWRTVADGKQVGAASPAWAIAKTVAVVLVLAFILTPVVTWAASMGSDSASVFDRLIGDSAAPGVEADEASGYPSPGTGSVTADVHIAGIAEQSSDTSKTLRVHLRNDGAQTHQDVRVRAIFYDVFGTELSPQDGSIGVVILAPGQEGYVKVWAHSDYGVGQYELELLDDAQ